MKFKIILTISLLLTFFSCKDPDCKEKGNCPPEYYHYKLGEVKNYLDATVGSYWIYKNSKTNELDTHTLLGYKFDSTTISGTQNYSKHITIKYEFIKRTIWSSYNQFTIYDATNGFHPDGTPLKGLFFDIDRQAVGKELYVFFYPFNKNNSTGTGSSHTSFLGMDSTFILHGKTFFNVARFNVDFDAMNEKNCTYIPNTNYYWAENVGLIKKEINNCNLSWELIDYKILK